MKNVLVLIFVAFLFGCAVPGTVKLHGQEGEIRYAGVADVAKDSSRNLSGAVHGQAPPSAPGHDAGQRDGNSGRIKQ